MTPERGSVPGALAPRALSTVAVRASELARVLVVLFKVRIVALLLFAAAGGAFLAAGGWPGFGPLIAMTLTGGLAAITNAPRLASGPGKVGEYLRLTKKQNGLDVTAGRTLWFEKGYRLAGETIVRRPRIGVDYAQEYKDKLWRFYLKNNPCVSKL